MLNDNDERIECSCGSECFYVTSFCNFAHCIHCGEGYGEHGGECAPDPRMIAAEFVGGNALKEDLSSYEDCPVCGVELDV